MNTCASALIHLVTKKQIQLGTGINGREIGQFGLGISILCHRLVSGTRGCEMVLSWVPEQCICSWSCRIHRFPPDSIHNFVWLFVQDLLIKQGLRCLIFSQLEPDEHIVRSHIALRSIPFQDAQELPEIIPWNLRHNISILLTPAVQMECLAELYHLLLMLSDITVYVDIQQDSGSGKLKKNVEADAEPTATLLQFLNFLKHEAEVLASPLEQVVVQVDGQRVPLDLKLSEIADGNQVKLRIINISHRSPAQPNPPQRSPDMEIEDASKVEAVFRMRDGANEFILSFKDQDDHISFNEIQERVFDRIEKEQLLDDFNRQYAQFKVFCNGVLFKKREKALRVLNIIEGGKVTFVLEREYPGGFARDMILLELQAL